MKKKYILYAIIPAVALALTGGVIYANTVQNPQGPMAGLVSKIAQKFNLNESDVQTVFNEYRSGMQANRQQHQQDIQSQMQQSFEDRINQAVSDGKLTQDQANAIIAKKAELQTQTQTTREQMQTIQQNLKQWAADNNIPQGYLNFGGFGFGRGHWGPGFMGKGQLPSQNNSAPGASTQ